MNSLNLNTIVREMRRIYILMPENEKQKLVVKLPENVEIEYIQSINEIKHGGVLLVWRREIKSIKEQCSIPVDCIENWKTGNIWTGSLLDMGVTEYIDFNQNRIVIDNRISPNICIERSVRGGENAPRIISQRNFVRLGAVQTISGNVNISFSGEGGYVRIDSRVTTKGLRIGVGGKGRVVIGNDVMMARNIEMWQSDGHMIFDAITGNRVNYIKDIVVGNHVWFGRDVMLLGGAVIPDGCVLGARSLTSRIFTEKNCILAGSPAKVIRHNVVWSRDSEDRNYANFSECSDQRALRYMDVVD